MLESIPGLPQFLGATLTGPGHTLGQRLLKRFNQTNPATTSIDEFLLRKVSLADLKGDIPEGYRLCRFHEGDLVETFTDEPPISVDEGDSLWLIPTDEFDLSTELPMGDTTAEADFVVEFDPGEALGRLLAKADQFDRGAIGEVVAAGLIAALALSGIGGLTALLQADRKKLGTFKTALNQSLRDQGIRCNQIREVRSRVTIDSEPKNAAHSPRGQSSSAGDNNEGSDEDYVSEILGRLKSEAEWKAVQAGLAEAGIPFDGNASRELAALREETLKRAISPTESTDRLAMLTARAFERAGVHLPDLVRWQNVSRRLTDEGFETNAESSPTLASPVGVATAKTPPTWWVWNQAEVDRRRLQFVSRSVNHCSTACNQALATIRDLPALRQLRELRDQLTLVSDLLDTMPPLSPEIRSLRVEGWKVKELLKSVEQAVSASDTVSAQTRRMLGANPGTSEWRTALQDCRQSIHLLIQNLNDRRAVR